MPQTQSSFNVAIVEDERILREELEYQLSHLGFTVVSFASVEAFYRYQVSGQRTILILDIGLHGEDGLSACRYLREHDVPIGIIMVTARSLDSERVEGLEAGADAYMVKPINLHELALVIRNIANQLYAMQSNGIPEVNQLCPWELDRVLGRLHGPGGGVLPVSRIEEFLLSHLLGNPNNVSPFAALAIAMGEVPEGFDKHRIEVIISRLRQRVLREIGQPLPVRSIRGVGYQFDCGP